MHGRHVLAGVLALTLLATQATACELTWPLEYAYTVTDSSSTGDTPLWHVPTDFIGNNISCTLVLPAHDLAFPVLAWTDPDMLRVVDVATGEARSHPLEWEWGRQEVGLGARGVYLIEPGNGSADASLLRMDAAGTVTSPAYPGWIDLDAARLDGPAVWTTTKADDADEVRLWLFDLDAQSWTIEGVAPSDLHPEGRTGTWSTYRGIAHDTMLWTAETRQGAEGRYELWGHRPATGATTLLAAGPWLSVEAVGGGHAYVSIGGSLRAVDVETGLWRYVEYGLEAGSDRPGGSQALGAVDGAHVVAGQRTAPGASWTATSDRADAGSAPEGMHIAGTGVAPVALLLGLVVCRSGIAGRRCRR